MSSILLSNPFPTQQPASQQTTEVPAIAAAVPVIKSGQASSSSDNATGFSRSGAGSGRQAENMALLQTKDTAKWTRPADATGGSVIDAQAMGPSGETALENLPLGPDLPKVEMPDPLPTSPFLKPNDFVA